MSNPSIPSCLAVHQFIGLQPGPKLIVFGAVHGNEVCGTIAIQRILRDIEVGHLSLLCGTLTLIPVVNPLAYQLRRRHGDRNLNRWMRVTDAPRDFEDSISNVICPLLGAHDVLLDLHSSHTPGDPFALFGPPNNNGQLEPFNKAEDEEQLALNLGVNRLVDGWLETYAQGVKDRQARGATANVEYGVGTTETMRRYGGIAITLECGQHDDEQAQHVAYDAILRTLAHLKMIKPEPATPTNKAEVISLYHVVDRFHPNDFFTKEWQDFDKVQKGEVIALRVDGTKVTAENDGWIVFPNADAQVNEEWFYLAKPSNRLVTN